MPPSVVNYEPFWHDVIAAYEAIHLYPDTHVEIERNDKRATLYFSPDTQVTTISVAQVTPVLHLEYEGRVFDHKSYDKDTNG